MKAIEVNGLIKRYGAVTAVNDISFSVEEGMFFAFLGPNGAGKSTTIDVLCTLITSDGGEVFINGERLGKNDKEIRQSIGVVYQNGVLDPFLTVRENLMFRGKMYGYNKRRLNERIEFVSEIADISGFENRRYGKLSGGQKRRADIARALLNEPKILFLDEPTTGLDPKTRQSIWECVMEMREKLGTTIFLTTHYMEEALHCNKIVIINEGKIIENGTPVYLKEKYTKDKVVLYTKSEAVFNYLENKKILFSRDAESITVQMSDKSEILAMLNDIASETTSFEVIKGNMDDVFLNILKEEA